MNTLDAAGSGGLASAPRQTRNRGLFARAAAAIGFFSGAWAAGADGGFLWAERSGGKLELTEAGRPVLVYNHGMQLKEGVKEQYRRACYVHPIFDLDGVALTDDFPKDHVHHRGLFWAWPEVVVNGETHDPWACAGIQQRFRRWLGREAQSDRALLEVENGWFVGERSVARETVRLEVHRAATQHRVLDVTVTLEAERDPVSVRGRATGGKGYGGFTLRFAARCDAAITMPAGHLAEDAVQVNAPWADFSARFDPGDAVSGIAIFDHPSNPGHPSSWLTRYYGILNPTWPALNAAVLEPGRPVTLRYRLVVHRGDAAAAGVAAACAAWIGACQTDPSDSGNP